MTSHPVSLIPPVVATTVETSYGHHRTPWFEGILERIRLWLRPTLPAEFSPLVLTATVSGAREAVITNVVTADTDLWLSNEQGAFASLAALPRSGSGPPGLVALVEHVDTSGRVLELERVVCSIRERAPDAIVIVDASISFGADVASLANVDADALILVPEGALMGIPGLSIVAAGPRLLDHIRACRPGLTVTPYYFDLLKYERSWAKRTTPYSPDISACVALAKSLDLIDSNGGIDAHVVRHAARARALRGRLTELGTVLQDGPLTNAFSTCQLPRGITARQVQERCAGSTVHVRAVLQDGHERLRIDHTGYLPDGALDAWCEDFRELTCHSDEPGAPRDTRPALPVFVLDVTPPPGIPPAPPLSIFEIPADEFVTQAVTHARRTGGGPQFEAKIQRSAAATFQTHPRYDPAQLASRTVGFIGAGNIVREAVERCQHLGVRDILVYSPSLARQKQGGTAARERPSADASSTRPASNHTRLEYWLARGVEIADTADDVFLRAHSIVLLPWFYDRVALGVFNKPSEYANERLIDGAVLSRIERDGRADLIVNAAARGKLVDREALLEALSEGWLRYYSDELPAADDPLLAFRNVRFTGHVGGSCRRPQALVGRNTHHILRRLVAHIVEGAPVEPPDGAGYSLNVLNAALVPGRGWRFDAPAIERPRQVRVLVTDPFDIEALDFDSLRKQGWGLEVLDVSGETPSTDRLAAHLRAFRPHILMVRSRTKIDATVAAVACEISELSAVVRPGVGIDNVYGGAQQLTSAGIRIINEPYGNSSAVAEMTLHFLVSAAENTLLAPGPTRVEPDVFAVMRDYRHPASPPVGAVVRDVAARFGRWMAAREPALVVSGSGTALMEAGILNLTQIGDRGLVVSHGKFGDRFVDIARAMKRSVDVLAVPEHQWGRAIAPADIERHFETCRSRTTAGEPASLTSFLCFQQNETSSGIAYRHDQLNAIVRAARSHNPEIVIIVDAISGAFAHDIGFDALDIDLLVVGSQKGLGVSSGLAFGQISRRAWTRMLTLGGYDGTPEQWLEEPDVDSWLRTFTERQRVWYLSLPRLWQEQHRLAFSDPPSVFHLLSTQRALDLHDRDGGRDAVIERHARLAAMVREELPRIGLAAMPDPLYGSDSVTPALLPDGIPASSVRKRLESVYGFSIAGAQGDYWKRQMVRIGHLGFVYEQDIARCLRGLHRVLADATREFPTSNSQLPTPNSKLPNVSAVVSREQPLPSQ